MPAYVSRPLSEFVGEAPEVLVGELNRAYSRDGFASQYTSQVRSWGTSMPALQDQLRAVRSSLESSAGWRVLLELPLYRLRRRIDLLILTNRTVVVVELKVGAVAFAPSDERQVEEYALDLRDFHGGSGNLALLPCLWATEAPHRQVYLRLSAGANPVQRIGKDGLAPLLETVASAESGLANRLARRGSRRPTARFRLSFRRPPRCLRVMGVREITHADASNLDESAARIIELLVEARELGVDT